MPIDYKVLITTSGIGSRLGDITRYTNKALVRVGKKPAISYIIEAYPKDTPFVVTLGYYGTQVKDFLELAYPDRLIEFIAIDKYEGPGTSLGHSMLKAKEALQCPFIYHACDTITNDPIPEPDKNWIGAYKGTDSSSYASWRVINDETLIFAEKGAIEFDYLHIGIIGIHQYQDFWSAMEDLYKETPYNTTLNDCQAIQKMLVSKKDFKLIKFESWFDIGNILGLNHARQSISDHFQNLDKNEESIFIFDNFVIKFFHDSSIATKRVTRAKILDNLVPQIESVKENFYRYTFVEGDLYSQVVNPSDFKIFLEWAKKDLWIENDLIDQAAFKEICRTFYYDKSIQRIDRFLNDNNIKDKEEIINGTLVPTIKELMSQIDFNWLSNTKQHRIHGDLVLENIIKTKDSYKLIDWRQDFGGLIETGDMYYDLAKLNHNLTIGHDMVSANNFSIQTKDNIINCDILRHHNLVDCQKTLFKFATTNDIDSRKIKLLTSLIWLNMSPLHHYPFSIFLYYFGKLNLWQVLNSPSHNASVAINENIQIKHIHDESSVHFHAEKAEEYTVKSGKIGIYQGTYYEGDLEKTIANLALSMLLPGDKITIMPHTVHTIVNLSSNGSTYFKASRGANIKGDIQTIYEKLVKDIQLAQQWTMLGYPQGLNIEDLIKLVRQGRWIQSEEESKTIVKPWGNATIGKTANIGEIWLNYKKDEEINEEEKHYIFKKMCVRAGSRLSLQYHATKLETQYLLSGKAEIWFENNEGKIEKKNAVPGDSWTIPRGRKHRLCAITDVVVLEASTPEADDVVRIEDDTNRDSGRIEREHHWK